MKEFKITLDLIESISNPTIYLKKDDLDSVKFIFEVLNDGEIYDLTNVTSVRLAVKKPSDISFYQDCVVTDAANGICEAVLVYQAYEEEGYNFGELYINENGTVQVTRQFEYVALESILATEEATGDVVYWDDVLSKPATFPPSAHTHEEMGGLTLWKGTQADYDLIATKDPNTLYFIVG